MATEGRPPDDATGYIDPATGRPRDFAPIDPGLGRLFDVPEAAAYAKVSEEELRRWIKARGLRTISVGTHGARGPRKYLIFERWVLDNMLAHSAVELPPPEPPPGEAPEPQTRPKPPAPPAGMLMSKNFRPISVRKRG